MAINNNCKTSFEDGDVCLGTVTDQVMGVSKNGYPQLQLTVELARALSNPKKPEGPTLALDATLPRRKRVLVTIRPDDEASVERGLRDLVSIGFQGDDLDTLRKEHPRHQSFTGKQVYCRVQISDKGEYWNLQNFRTFEAREMSGEEMKALHRNYGSVISQAFSKIRAGTPSTGVPAVSTSSEQPPF